MPICKIVKQYDNADRWSMGDVVEITNPTRLIAEGKVVLLNDKGEEIARPGASMKCPICVYEAASPTDLATHILSHGQKTESVPVKTDDVIKQKRLDALEKARAAKRLKQLNKNVKKHEAEAKEALKEVLEATSG